MRNEQTVKDIYKIAGMLELLSCMKHCPITEGIIVELEDAVDKLELIGAEMMQELDGQYMVHVTPRSDLIDLFRDARMETDVNAHEEAEESPPEAHQPDQ